MYFVCRKFPTLSLRNFDDLFANFGVSYRTTITSDSFFVCKVRCFKFQIKSFTQLPKNDNSFLVPKLLQSFMKFVYTIASDLHVFGPVKRT